MLIKTVVVDDETPAREELVYLLESSGMVEICGEADCGEDAVRLVSKYKPDLVFLDICLGDIDGLTVARELAAAGSQAFIVFATAYNRYAVEAFDIFAIDYILKPFVRERLEKTLMRARKVIEEKTATGSLTSVISRLLEDKLRDIWGNNKRFNKIPAYYNNSLHLVEPEDILYVCIEGGNVFIVTGSGKMTSNWPLQELEKKLGSEMFYRTHRAFLVNLTQITIVVPWFKGTYKLVLKGGQEVPVSRFYVKGLKELLDIKNCVQGKRNSCD